MSTESNGRRYSLLESREGPCGQGQVLKGFECDVGQPQIRVRIHILAWCWRPLHLDETANSGETVPASRRWVDQQDLLRPAARIWGDGLTMGLFQSQRRSRECQWRRRHAMEASAEMGAFSGPITDQLGGSSRLINRL